MSHQQHADNVEGITPYCRDTCKHEQVQHMFDNIAASYEAQGNAEAKRIGNEADKTVDITISEANSQSEKLKAAGEAAYMRILS